MHPTRLEAGAKALAVLLGAVLGLAAAAPAATASVRANEPTPEPDGRPTLTRIADASATTMSVQASQRAFADGLPADQTVFLAPLEDLSLSATWGSLNSGPVLFVPRCGKLPREVRNEIRRLNPAYVVGLGGASALCSQLLKEAAGQRASFRLAGANRFAMSEAIGKFRATKGQISEVYLAGGNDLESAALGGQLSAGPTLLVSGSPAVQAQVRKLIATWKPRRVVALSGKTQLPDLWVDAVAGQRRTVRIGKNDPVVTAAAVAGVEYNEASRSTYLIGRGSIAEAIVSGGFTDGPMVYVPQDGNLPDSLTKRLAVLTPSQVVAVGTEAALPEPAVQAALAAIADAVTPGLEIEPRVEVLTEAERAAITRYSPQSGEVELAAAPLSAGTIVPGDVITSLPSAQAPDGMLRKVTSVRRNGNGVVYVTEQATLADAIARTAGAVHLGGNLLSVEATPADGVVVTRGDQGRARGQREGPSSDGGAGRRRAEAQAQVSGEVTFTATK